MNVRCPQYLVTYAGCAWSHEQTGLANSDQSFVVVAIDPIPHIGKVKSIIKQGLKHCVPRINLEKGRVKEYMIVFYSREKPF